MLPKKVSIIMPMYNVAPYIEQALGSALNQTYKEIEYIIIDDCSSDNSMEIVMQMKNDYPEKDIHVLRHIQNKGQSAARNTGINAATGKYLFFMDSDDLISCDCIALHVSVIERYDADFTQGGLVVVGGRNPQKELHQITVMTEKDTICQCFFDNRLSPSPCNKLIRSDFLKQNNVYFTEGIIYEDIEWVFKLSQAANSLVNFPSKTYQYIIRKNSTITSSITLKHINSREYLQKMLVDYIKGSNNKKMIGRARCYLSEQQFKYSTLIAISVLDKKTKKDFYRRLNAPDYNQYGKGVYSFFTKQPFEIFYYMFYLSRKVYSFVVHSKFLKHLSK